MMEILEIDTTYLITRFANLSRKPVVLASATGSGSDKSLLRA